MAELPEYILAIETATQNGSVCLLKNGAPVGQWIGDNAPPLSSELLPQISALLDSHSITITDIGLLAVCSGPGSFTGVRIGLSTAKGLQDALDIPAITATLTEVLAESVLDDSGDVITIIPSGRDEVYYQRFQRSSEGAVSVSSIEVGSVSDAAQLGGAYITTPDLKPEHIDSLRSREGNSVEVANGHLAAHVGAIAIRKFNSGTSSDLLAPVYVKEFAIGR